MNTRATGASLRPVRRFVLLTALAALLSGCGFQLRDSAVFPAALSPLYVETGDRYSVFYRALQARLRDSGIWVVDDPSVAGTILLIEKDETGRRVLSVSARNVPREYEVFYSVRYALLRGASMALEPQSLTVTRDYTYDETLVLGKSREEETLREAIAGDLVGLIARRLNSLDHPARGE